MIKAYIQVPYESFTLVQIRNDIRDHSLNTMTEVLTQEEADVVLLYVIGKRDHIAREVHRLKGMGKKVVLLQCALRSTRDPDTMAWIDIWREADLVWSYYDLKQLLKDDGHRATFNFYHSPLGVNKVFKQHGVNKEYAIVTNGEFFEAESYHEIWTAAEMAGVEVMHIGKVFDYYEAVTYIPHGGNRPRMSGYFSQCHYVSGLRRKEGFELPAAEGLVCGARPVLYDRPHYRKWFGDLAEYIPEEKPAEVIKNLVRLFSQPVRTVMPAEIEEARQRFDWQNITDELWRRCA
jgi:hypothetical protein